jgi:hypothetical protein
MLDGGNLLTGPVREKQTANLIPPKNRLFLFRKRSIPPLVQKESRRLSGHGSCAFSRRRRRAKPSDPALKFSVGILSAVFETMGEYLLLIVEKAEVLRLEVQFSQMGICGILKEVSYK